MSLWLGILGGQITFTGLPAVAGYMSRSFDGSVYTNTMYKWAFPSDSVSTTTSTTNVMNGPSGFSNTGVAGYLAEGTGTSKLYKFAYPSDSISNAPESTATHWFSGSFANPSIAGYICASNSTSIRKWTFPSDTVSTPSAVTPGTMLRNSGAFGNYPVAGYMHQGGNINTGMYKLSFASDSISNTTTNAGNTGQRNAGFANPNVAGYINGSGNTQVRKWTFPSDSYGITNGPPANFNLVTQGNAGFATPGTSGYFSQGGSTTVWKWAFPSDTVSTTNSSPATMGHHGGFANA